MSAKKQRGWFGSKSAHREIGRKGGLATATIHGHEFYKKIGSKGGKARGKGKKSETLLSLVL